MSMSVIRAETDQLRSVAGQMRQVAEQIGGGADVMNQAMEALAAVWNGQAADRGKQRWSEIYPKYRPDGEHLLHLAGELEALATRLDDAAAVFGDTLGGGGGGATTTTLHDDYGDELPTEVEGISIVDLPKEEDPKIGVPQNMAELFDLIPHDAKDVGNDEIAVYRLSDGSYVIGLKGTDWGDSGDLDSGENAILGASGETSYSHKLRDVLAGLPDNASIHLAGYSQGGMVAQRVAADLAIFGEGKLQLKSLTTFGSPDMGFSIPDTCEQKHFDAPGDIVSNLPLTNNPTEMFNFSLKLLNDPVGVFTQGLVDHTQSYQNEWLPDHLIERDSMAQTKTPWATEDPKGLDPWPERVATGVGEVAADAASGVNKAVSDLQNTAKDVGEDMLKLGGNVVDEVAERVPGPLKGFLPV